MDWAAWHEDYDDPGSALARRLAAVQTVVRQALDRSPPGPLTAVSMCAGQGRDLIGVLASHPRGGDVRARLVEIDPRNVAFAERSARQAGLTVLKPAGAGVGPTVLTPADPGGGLTVSTPADAGSARQAGRTDIASADTASAGPARPPVTAPAGAGRAGPAGIEVVTGDAGLMRHYRDLAPADLVLACGVFGNLTDADVLRTVEACARLCREGGTVVWTRHRRPPDLVPVIGDWFAARGFEPVYVSDPAAGFGLGAHRLCHPPKALESGDRIFTFVPEKQASRP